MSEHIENLGITCEPMTWHYCSDGIVRAYPLSLCSAHRGDENGARDFEPLAEINALRAEVARMRGVKEDAYHERDQLVAVLSKLFPSKLARHSDADAWDNDWRWIVFVDLPTGQASWHIHDSELSMFDHLERLATNPWDGHDTPTKYARLAAIRDAARGNRTQKGTE